MRHSDAVVADGLIRDHGSTLLPVGTGKRITLPGRDGTAIETAIGDDIDPDTEAVRLADGTRLTAARAAALADEVIEAARLRDAGPFYDTASVQALLGVSRQAVEARRKKHTILAVQTADGRWAYPTFQFTGGDVDPALVSAIHAFREAPAWSAAVWFLTPNPDLDDAIPLEWVQDRRPTDALVVSAQRTAREWQ